MVREVCGYEVEYVVWCSFFFFQAEDGIRDLVRSRGLGDVYKRQAVEHVEVHGPLHQHWQVGVDVGREVRGRSGVRPLSLIHI